VVGIGEGATHPVTVTLTATCPGPTAQPRVTRTSTPIEGGCITTESAIPDSTTEVVPSFEPGGGFSYVDRSELVTAVARDEDLTLCGAGAPPCDP
jgi:hypothetical protein